MLSADWITNILDYTLAESLHGKEREEEEERRVALVLLPLLAGVYSQTRE